MCRTRQSVDNIQRQSVHNIQSMPKIEEADANAAALCSQHVLHVLERADADA
jgi:hypothetical protein